MSRDGLNLPTQVDKLLGNSHRISDTSEQGIIQRQNKIWFREIKGY